MTLRIGWLSPFTRRTGVGTFSKAITDAMPEAHRGQAIDLTIVAPVTNGTYRTRHRFVDIASVRPDSRLYDLFDVLVCNIGNNTEHHKSIVEVLRNVPAVVICHDYVYQHYLATIIYERHPDFADYVALNARFGRPEAMRTIRQSNLTRGRGLVYAPWDSDFSGAEPLGAPLLKLGSALVVHSRFAETYARAHFDGPLLRLGMPHDQRGAPKAVSGDAAKPAGAPTPRRADGRLVAMSFGHVQATKCIDDVLEAIAASDRLRESLVYVISGFTGSRDYVNHLRALVDDLDLGRNVRFALDVSDDELVRLSGEADVFVNLRYPNTEGASVSLIEQLVTGKPVMVLDSGCYAELPDDAVIKVAKPRDVGAIRDAMLRMVADRSRHAEIGRRGRAHAMSHDCRGYVSALLDFLAAERDRLARRKTASARCLADIETPADFAGGDATDEAWLDALAAARASLDLLDQGRLALDPELVRDIDRGALADYVQAAILRDGTNPRLTAALKTYLAGEPDAYRAVRLLRLVHEVGFGGSEEAHARLPDVCPHADPRFWDVVASLGPAALASVFYHAFFRMPPPDHLLSAHGDAGRDTSRDTARDGGRDVRHCTSPEARLAAEAETVDRTLLACPEDRFDAALAHLVGASIVSEIVSEQGGLELLPVGSSIAIGSPEHKRYLRLSGFFDPESDHAWTGAEPGIVYLRPGSGAKRIVVTGYSLDAEAAVSFSAASFPAVAKPLGEKPRPAACEPTPFEIDLDATAAEGSAPLRLAIRSTLSRSPADLGLSADDRPLGFCLKRIALS